LILLLCIIIKCAAKVLKALRKSNEWQHYPLLS